MRINAPITFLMSALLAVASLAAAGCGPGIELRRQPSAPLGMISDSVWQLQEQNAEASDFVVYQHEFKLNGVRLNTAGEDHLKQISERLLAGQDFPVVIERSMTMAREDTTYKYPVHPDPELDMKRREVVVRCLLALGVQDADARVVVAPAFATGFKGTEATRAYLRGLMSGGGFGGGMGGGMGGGFGGGF
jgi:hypothetical protein